MPIAVLTGIVHLCVAQHPHTIKLDANIPGGPIDDKWDRHRFEMKLVNPANKRKYNVIVVGSGLAGGAAAATLAELGYNVKCFCFQDSPRRAHTIAAQGGINAAKNYQNDGDSVYRLFYDTIKGGDFRAREANVYRLAQVSVEHHRPVRGAGRAVRARVRRPARQPIVRRRAGLAHVLRPRPDRPAAAARRLPGARCGRSRAGTVKMFPRREMLDLVVVDGRARGIIARDLVTGEVERTSRDAVRARDRRLRQRLLPLDERQGLQRHRDLARVQAGRAVRQPVLHADPSDLHPGDAATTSRSSR